VFPAPPLPATAPLIAEMLAVVVAGPVREVGFANEFIIRKQNKNLSTR
jgi:hypothetical protein